MPEEAVVEQPANGSETNQGNQQDKSPGWLAGLPADLRENETFKSYRTVGDFAKFHLDTAKKATDLEAKLKDSIPKLPDDATQEERDLYFESLGRPGKADEYELDAEDKADPQGLKEWKQDFHELGFTKSQAKELSARFNKRINALVDAHNAKIQQMNTEAETQLKTEWGDKYEANVELANRFWKKEVDTELDKVFEGANSAQRTGIMRFIFKMAAKTGEDISQPGGQSRSQGTAQTGLSYAKSNMPGRRP